MSGYCDGGLGVLLSRGPSSHLVGLYLAAPLQGSSRGRETVFCSIREREALRPSAIISSPLCCIAMSGFPWQAPGRRIGARMIGIGFLQAWPDRSGLLRTGTQWLISGALQRCRPLPGYFFLTLAVPLARTEKARYGVLDAMRQGGGSAAGTVGMPRWARVACPRGSLAQRQVAGFTQLVVCAATAGVGYRSCS